MFGGSCARALHDLRRRGQQVSAVVICRIIAAVPTQRGWTPGGNVPRSTLAFGRARGPGGGTIAPPGAAGLTAPSEIVQHGSTPFTRHDRNVYPHTHPVTRAAYALIRDLAPLLFLAALAWIWLAGARARELATSLARVHCERRGLQFLDETVSLARMGLRWTRQGLRVRRMFRFEFSLEGVGRQTAYILLLGMHLEFIDDGLIREQDAEDDIGQQAPPPGEVDRKVVPFRRRDG
ncbi:MAG: DUF3301 domain-containing protein [Gammaproteobacteria bacterium]|nr:DUF3301 domain-containing protein [Gammaproteobacteria bacterium]